ncbi:MAG: hypothetical protein JWO52_7070, partial [Gammaproteobacteria bacterium]|nr:hypothetical protein [Gammaproteobacteria bacterium]
MKTGRMLAPALLFASALALLANRGIAQNAVPAEKGASTELTEIVVTANKRDERLQSVPASVTAVLSETMEKQEIREIK